MSDEAAVAAIVERAARLLGTPLRGARPLPGGHSGVTLVADTPAGDAVVVKATPPGRRAVGRHDVLRQVRGIEVASAAVPVPRILATSADDPPFFVMSFEPGEAAEPAHDEAESGDDRELVRARFAAATGLLSRLHGLDTVALVEAGEVPTTPADELAKWERTLGAVDAGFREAGERAFAALAASVPALWRTTFVHGDFRLGNVLFEGAVPRAVIDWEIWSVGDPRVDLGWYLTFCDPADFPGIGYPARCLPPAAELLAAYERDSGGPVPDAAWFLALGAFKMGVIMAHNLERHRSGRHVDPFQEQLPPTIEHLLARALLLATDGLRTSS
ncbi:MAG TPA: phosphotransferase family protein [Acidimicrobiales bacterium]|nr:phosphotransferase family protein [Acidimicrobiales bacterium]